MIKIYLAGPLFTTYERKFIDDCALTLRDEGFEVFVPHEKSVKQSSEHIQEEKQSSPSTKERAIEVFNRDYEGVSWANVLIAIVDGTQVDDGTATEIGIFAEQMLSGQNKLGMFGLSSDSRVGPNADTGEGKGLNYFTAGAIYRVGGDIYDDINGIITELKKIEN